MNETKRLESHVMTELRTIEDGMLECSDILREIESDTIAVKKKTQKMVIDLYYVWDHMNNTTERDPNAWISGWHGLAEAPSAQPNNPVEVDEKDLPTEKPNNGPKNQNKNATQKQNKQKAETPKSKPNPPREQDNNPQNRKGNQKGRNRK